MATWVTHLMIADAVLKQFPGLDSFYPIQSGNALDAGGAEERGRLRCHLQRIH